MGEKRQLDRDENTYYTRRSMFLLSNCFGINHAAVTTPIQFQTSLLGSELGNIDNMLLYLCTMFTALFLGSLLNDKLGARVGLTWTMAGYAIYVLLFATVLLLPVGEDGFAGPAGKFCGVLGSVIGGFAAGPLWTFQGVVVGKIVEDVAEQESLETDEQKQALSGSLWGTFGLWFLGWEAVIRAGVSLLNKAGASQAVTFYVLAAMAFGATALWHLCTPSCADTRQPAGTLCGKAAKAISMWSDPKILLLQFTNVTFGFGAAWNASYCNKTFISDNPVFGSAFLGLLSAVISLIGGVSARGFSFVTPHIGKGPVIFIGAAAFFLIGLFSLVFPDAEALGFGAIVFPILMGLGRGVYESTNKGVFNDFYPRPETRAGVFANVMVFGTLSSAIVFALGFLNKSESVAANPVIYLLMIFSATTGPSLLLAWAISKKQQKAEGMLS